MSWDHTVCLWNLRAHRHPTLRTALPALFLLHICMCLPLRCQGLQCGLPTRAASDEMLDTRFAKKTSDSYKNLFSSS